VAKLKDLLRFLRDQGWEQDRQESSHRVWRHRDGRRVVIAAHESQELSRAKLAKILKDAGYSLDEFFGR
jgi:predicted RNA binding protein YcfA (HicA-like mRNA interferase family)